MDNPHYKMSEEEDFTERRIAFFTELYPVEVVAEFVRVNLAKYAREWDDKEIISPEVAAEISRDLANFDRNAFAPAGTPERNAFKDLPTPSSDEKTEELKRETDNSIFILITSWMSYLSLAARTSKVVRLNDHLLPTEAFELWGEKVETDWTASATCNGAVDKAQALEVHRKFVARLKPLMDGANGFVLNEDGVKIMKDAEGYYIPASA